MVAESARSRDTFSIASSDPLRAGLRRTTRRRRAEGPSEEPLWPATLQQTKTISCDRGCEDRNASPRQCDRARLCIVRFIHRTFHSNEQHFSPPPDLVPCPFHVSLNFHEKPSSPPPHSPIPLSSLLLFRLATWCPFVLSFFLLSCFSSRGARGRHAPFVYTLQGGAPRTRQGEGMSWAGGGHERGARERWEGREQTRAKQGQGRLGPDNADGDVQGL